MVEVSNMKRAFTVSFPPEEAKAVLDEVNKLNISITMLFRMWVSVIVSSWPGERTVTFSIPDPVPKL